MIPEEGFESPLRADALDLPVAPDFIELNEVKALWADSIRQLRGKPKPDLAGIRRTFRAFRFQPERLREVLRVVWKLEV
ncbi:MAG TPA: hypothetical protein PLZ66_01145 [Rectinema sp.]|nr:hypothetical protein [Rectinema sp.]